MHDYRVKALTDGSVRKYEVDKESVRGIEILKQVPSEKLQGNESKISLVADDGDVIAIYFGVKSLGDEQPHFEDLTFLYTNVELVSLKYIKSTNTHYYKYYVRFNPLNISIDNVVATGFTSNDRSVATLYIVPKILPNEEDNRFFFYENYKGITISVDTGKILMETEYEPMPAEGS